jgi:hypothetical protein
MATHICQTSVVNNDRFFFVSDLEEGEDACDDFIYELTDEVSDFISLLGDGITVACVLEGVEVKRVIFRQLTETDFLKLKKTPASLREVAANALFRQSTPLDPVDVKKKPLWQLRKEYKKNMPSEDRTQIVHAKNRESGFYIFSLDGINQMVYFCNNMLSRKDEENSQWMAYFLYQSNAVVFSSGLPKESISDDNDMCIFNAELLILGTVINYKGYYGLDNSLDLGQYKALKDSLEKNQENVQITHLEKKKYYEK